MAALCPGVQYGLSSQENFGENKDLIFVRLTDSAHRAIEEYLRNKNKLGKGPTIKFQGNEGQLSFPSQHNGSTSFNFLLSSTSDMEGPAGSLECLQQTGRGQLSHLGPISTKIRIRANDDVYETTKQRMTVAEEIHKNKCAREIKMNQTDIGRKVKVKHPPGRPVPPARRESPLTAYGGGGGGGGRDSMSNKMSSSYSSNNQPPPPSLPSKQQQQQLQQAPTSLSLNSSSTQNSSSHPSNGLMNGSSGGGNNHVPNKPQNKPSLPDIARRPIKERLIHLLALRPFKKPELYERLMREGLREKNAMTSVLKQIAFLKDNSYHLNRAMWNDVHEDWQFYTESEKQILKRRKPQNLTPPGSSDGGSSGSGHSPTSTHPGSPPPPISTSKRPGYFDGADGLQTKKPRISHYKRPIEQTYRSPVENNSQRRPMTDSRDASNMNPRSRESPTTNGYHHHATQNPPPPQAPPPPPPQAVNGYNNTLNEKRTISDEDDISPSFSSRKRPCDNFTNVSQGQTFRDRNSPKSLVDDLNNGTGDNNRGNSNNNTTSTTNNRDVLGDAVLNGRNKPSDEKNKEQRYNNKNSQNSRMVRGSPDGQSEKIISDSGSMTKVKDHLIEPQFPDYLSEYTDIKDVEQRRRYKSDFNADYAEYRSLHGVVEKVSRRFAELEERLKQETSSSPKYVDIKRQIVQEYQLNKKDEKHQRAKRRFQYLHEKLSHIKRLVQRYDNEMVENRSQY